jgi:hypothetical protein
MENNAVAKPLSRVSESVIARPVTGIKETVVTEPLLAGIIYGEIVFWFILIGLAVSVTGLFIYLASGGYFNSTSLLNHLWAGSDSSTIWREVGNVSEPLPWYTCIKMLSKGDMFAVLGMVITGVAGVVGMWGAFLGMLRTKNGIYIIFAMIITLVLTLSVMGVLEI